MSRGAGLLFVSLFLSACASQAPPTGGPEDKTPPAVISAFPANNATDVPTDSRVVFTFSEKIKKPSAEGALFFSPEPEGKVRYSWRQHDLEIRFENPLKQDQTYVITVGTDVVDLRNNPLKHSHTLAFSTGPEIDRGEIRGRVIGENAGLASVWAYRIDSTFTDSTVITDRADYITRCGVDGSYALSYLSPGRYRVIAVNDLDKNRRYDPGKDPVGIAQADIDVADSTDAVPTMFFRLAKEDTAAFRMTDVSVADLNHVTLFFSQDLAKVDSVRFELSDSLTGDPVSIRNVYRFPNLRRALHLFTDTLKKDTQYRIGIQGLSDDYSDTLLVQTFFSSGNRTDNIRPAIRFIDPADGSRNVLPRAVVRLEFSEPVDMTVFEDRFHLQDSVLSIMPGKFVWDGPVRVSFAPSIPLLSRAAYRYGIQADSVFDFAGNSLGDSLFTFRFRTTNFDTLGSLSGQIEDDRFADSGGAYVVVLTHIASGAERRVTVARGTGFVLADLLPGKYLLSSFRDQDENGSYSHGRSIPVRFSERFTATADTVTVRKLWELSGTRVVYPR